MCTQVVTRMTNAIWCITLWALFSITLAPIHLVDKDGDFKRLMNRYKYTIEVSQPSSLNYMDCCIHSEVKNSCLPFCERKKKAIFKRTGQENCQRDFAAIVKCMVAGRNHVPCCVRERVPDICQDFCRGDYTPVTDNIKTHYSCATYAEKILACVKEGIELLPGPPVELIVDPLKLNVSWTLSPKDMVYVTEYTVNVSSQQSPRTVFINKDLTNSTIRVYTLPSYMNSVVLQDLEPFTLLYEIAVTISNPHGNSLPRRTRRALKGTPEKVLKKPNPVAAAPKLPDVRSCCINAGVTHHYGCVDNLCNPKKIAEIKRTDLVNCGSWLGAIFGCLANGKDNTPCCKKKGLPDICQSYCSGNVTKLKFDHINCAPHMGTYKDCLLLGYGVLPGPVPLFYLQNVKPHSVLVHWYPPEKLGKTVEYYNIYLKTNRPGDRYIKVKKVCPPRTIKGLMSNTRYEMYFEAVNENGVGEPSKNWTFDTPFEEKQEETAKAYNITTCCKSVQLAKACMPLCSYDAKMSDLIRLAPSCTHEHQKLLKCAAGGRNHQKCCVDRDVPTSCQKICTGAYTDDLNFCASYVGIIFQCFEDGTRLQPGPPRELRAVVSTHQKTYADGPDNVETTAFANLDWEPAQDGAYATSYRVYWKIHDNTLTYDYDSQQSTYNIMNVTDTTARVDNLEVNRMYHAFVVAVNSHGESLPPGVLLFNISEADQKVQLTATASQPLSLKVESPTTTSLALSWQFPQLSPPDEILSYNVFVTSQFDNKASKFPTIVTDYTLKNLSSNTLYNIWVTAHTEAGDSPPSQTLRAWTEPTYQACIKELSVSPKELGDGSNMTVYCLATGIPTPVISIFISGSLAKRERTNFAVHAIHNVTKDMIMISISCHTNNAYGTPVEQSGKNNISCEGSASINVTRTDRHEATEYETSTALTVTGSLALILVATILIGVLIYYKCTLFTVRVI